MTLTDSPTLPTATSRSTPWRIAAAVALVGGAWVLSTSVPGRLVAIVILMVLAVRWSLAAVIVGSFVIYTAVDDPGAGPYNGLWTSPIQHIGDVWFETISTSVPGLPIRVAPMLLVGLIALGRAATGRTAARSAYEPPRVQLPRWFGTAILVAFGVLAVFLVYGVGTGGDVQQSYYQMLGPAVAICLVGATAVVATPQLATTIWRILLVVACYRATLAIYIWWTVARGLPEPPLYLTSHLDSLLWALGIVWLVSRYLEEPTRRSGQLLLCLAPLMGIALVVNNRRLAWVVLMGALAYVLLSASPTVVQRLRSVSMVAIPVLALYTAAGLASPENRLFAPVQSIQSVVVGDDSSSQTRDIEDFNLTVSMRQIFPLPAGFGKEYTEYIVGDDISRSFPQYRYLPHNSMLGLLLMVGPVGLALLLAPFAMAVHVTHALRRSARDPKLRTLAAMTVAAWIGFLAHAWGDLGWFTSLTVATVGIACGLGIGMHGWYAAEWADEEELR